MRCWHYRLIPYLPKAMLVSQWRECIAIKRQWEKGTLKHRLVSYVMDYDRDAFFDYVIVVLQGLNKRKIDWSIKLFKEISEFCPISRGEDEIRYLEHNDRYLKQCLYNLQEKADRGIITQEEWQLIYDNFKEYLD